MPAFSTRSKSALLTCDNRLQRVFNEVIKHYDCIVLEGHRGKDAQNEAYRKGTSQLKWPNGNHNKLPSRAVDVAPFPIDWNNRERFVHFAGFVKGIAAQMGILLTWGGDWNDNWNLKDQTFFDLPHFELRD